MPGTYAPPAVELPKTSAIVGSLRALARVTASEYGRPAAGCHEARELLKVT